MCLQKGSDQLYQGTRSVIADFLAASTDARIAPAFPAAAPQQSDAERFLRQLLQLWSDHTVCLCMVRDILMYLDRTHVKTAGLPPVYDMGMETFRETVIHSKKHAVQSALVSTVLHQILLERDGEAVDRLLLRGITEMMMMLPAAGASARLRQSLYDTSFERAFLDASETFYARESEILLKECNAIDFLKRAEKRLEEEDQRVEHYLAPATGAKIRAIVESHLLQGNVTSIIEMDSGLVSLINNDRLDDLSRMYRLLGRVPNGHPALRAALAKFVKSLGAAVNESLAAIPAPPTEGSDDATASASPSRPVSASAAVASMSGVDPSAGSSSSAPAPTTAKVVSPIAWVEGMIALKDRFDALLDRCFMRDKSFQNEINAAIEVSIALNPKSPEFLSLFLDENLRKGIKGKPEEEVEAFLDKAIAIFRFVREKDVFERYYKQHLAKRLLYGRSASEDTEKSIITKLKVECGYQFISRLEGMFKDMSISVDLSAGFRTFVRSRGADGSDDRAADDEAGLAVEDGDKDTASAAALATAASHGAMPELFVHTLTNTFWPMSAPTATTCHFPAEIAAVMAQFQRFYMSRHSGRRLAWMQHMGTADIRAHFERGRKELSVSTFAMVVLLKAFNDMSSNEPVSFETLLAETEIPESDLRRTLQSLALGKYRVLIKASKGKDVLASDTFTVNTQFASPLSKIKILTVAASGGAASGAGGAGSSSGAGVGGSSSSVANTLETDAERSETLDKINEHRKHQIEAAIVRVMKARRVMRHSELVAEVISQLAPRFSPDPVVVKRRIEGLIEREYMERDSENRQMYRYLA
ncbi:hypothetical protein HK105_201103 [Polyrhizophydium stewartii]|uniref:Cullin family profile domain-containing protein n=1 Tax=Polyrhizophydium stewartii TaxID=2732419 RepID=A0ABR4NIV6_9FUNG